MLIISRKLKEKLRIGDSVIVINRVAGNRVTLGIEAPADVKILRDELCKEGSDGKETPCVG